MKFEIIVDEFWGKYGKAVKGDIVDYPASYADTFQRELRVVKDDTAGSQDERQYSLTDIHNMRKNELQSVSHLFGIDPADHDTADSLRKAIKRSIK